MRRAPGRPVRAFFVRSCCSVAVQEHNLRATPVYKSCTKHFPVLLCSTMLAQNTPLCYYVLPSFYKIHSSTSLYYKACKKTLPSTTLYCTICTKLFPVLLFTAKLIQSTSQYYCVLQSLHKAFPNVTLYYKDCTKQFPVPLCTTTELEQTACQYYFVLQSLHKKILSTTLY